MTTDEQRRDVSANTAETPDIETGRYLYCVVQADDDATLDTTGIDGESVSVVTEDGIGAVVHDCDSLYDSADLTQIQHWLVRHQTVVDAAGQAFGTPVPFQFDTILRGDDTRLREWLREESATLRPVLSELADHWEYRIEVVEFDTPDDRTLVEQDDRLAELDEQIADASEGQAFLLEKQFEQRLTELRTARRETMAAELEAELAETVREVHTLERSPASDIADVARSEDETRTEDGDDVDTLCRLTVLAHEDDEDAVGSILDGVAAEDGLEVRFTGPWPPYTFAPELGTDPDGQNGDPTGAGTDTNPL
ncbi:gas vesicle protein GvpL [Natrialba sp. PRR66]|uniref:gas vesicle protein GvpL n=1 Tax=Natrialba sp. PRR66 TaxID=3098146 RepID=UPI002B1DA1CC|nr:GvpL/GvpF family gas vesicle protein [Natrialba sp. PRR66]